MPISATRSRVVFNEPISPYRGSSRQYKIWHRIRYYSSDEARWFPEDENGDVFGYNCFMIVTRVGEDHPMERKFRSMQN